MSLAPVPGIHRPGPLYPFFFFFFPDPAKYPRPSLNHSRISSISAS